MAARTAASAVAQSGAMTTPLPAANPSAFTTTGQPSVPAARACNASAAVSHTIDADIGTPQRCMIPLAKALLVSS